ncbi:MAG: DUF5020 family protein [Bacteroidales bacterium]
MRKFTFITLLVCMVTGLTAQNVQLHYDFGRSLYGNEMEGRPKVTTTVEMFRPDNWGSTFFFVDMDYTKSGVALAYWEIARDLKFWNGPFSAHFEYNGGLTNVASLSNCYLAGPTYTFNTADYSKGFSLSAMYKFIQHSTFFHGDRNNFQLTGTWYVHFADGKCSFTGFADWWREENLHGDFIFMTEPQFWVNLNKFKKINEKFNLSVGTELELTYNFGGRNGFYAVPTLAMKWSF